MTDISTTPESEENALARSDMNLVWLDMEMTGLDPDNDRIIEIAVFRAQVAYLAFQLFGVDRTREIHTITRGSASGLSLGRERPVP